MNVSGKNLGFEENTLWRKSEVLGEGGVSGDGDYM